VHTDLYTKTSLDASRLITRRYSTSFSLGILMLEPRCRGAIYAIYGFVRLADEVVDTFHEYDKSSLLCRFRDETNKALEHRISTNPVLHAFQHTVHAHKIDYSYIDAFFNSMEMDLLNASYQREKYDAYIYGSAEVVGLMCLKVFCDGNDTLFRDLTAPARALGSAFQKVNFLRDIGSDIQDRGRIYLPGVTTTCAISDTGKQQLEKEIEREFKEAMRGIRRLPGRVKFGVYTAYLYYYVLFNKIRKRNVQELMKKRIRISEATKIALLCRSLLTAKFLR
jgi:15-cis-phytoene synthase